MIAGGTTLFDYRAELERFAERADQLGVTEHVWRLGALESEELERLFRAADVFAFPSVKEGFGLVALEAIAAGLPLVASDLDVFRGFLTDGESALLTPVGDPDALAHALARVKHDKALRTRLRAGGRDVVAQHTLGRLRRARTSASTSTSRSRDGGDRDVPRRLLRDGHRARSHRVRSTSRRRPAATTRASCRPSCCSAASRAASRSRSATPPASATSICRTCA